MKLTPERRRALRASQFALPDRRKLPVSDVCHVGPARARLEQMRGAGHVTRAEYKSATKRIDRAERKFGARKCTR